MPARASRRSSTAMRAVPCGASTKRSRAHLELIARLPTRNDVVRVALFEMRRPGVAQRRKLFPPPQFIPKRRKVAHNCLGTDFFRERVDRRRGIVSARQGEADVSRRRVSLELAQSSEHESALTRPGAETRRAHVTNDHHRRTVRLGDVTRAKERPIIVDALISGHPIQHGRVRSSLRCRPARARASTFARIQQRHRARSTRSSRAFVVPARRGVPTARVRPLRHFRR